MSGEPRSDLHLEIARVLFIDIIGYSKLLVDEAVGSYSSDSTLRSKARGNSALRKRIVS